MPSVPSITTAPSEPKKTAIGRTKPSSSPGCRTIGGEESAELNRKDGVDYHEPGKTVDRFPSEAAVVAAAVKFCRKTFPELRALLEGHVNDDIPRWPSRVFWTPDKAITKMLNAINDAYREAEDKEDEAAQKELSAEWREAWTQAAKKSTSESP